jgi:hypothetical protein
MTRVGYFNGTNWVVAQCTPYCLPVLNATASYGDNILDQPEIIGIDKVSGYSSVSTFFWWLTRKGTIFNKAAAYAIMLRAAPAFTYYYNGFKVGMAGLPPVPRGYQSAVIPKDDDDDLEWSRSSQGKSVVSDPSENSSGGETKSGPGSGSEAAN